MKKSHHKRPAVSKAATTAEAGDPFRPWLLAGLAMLLIVRPLYPSESAATQGDGLAVVMLWLALAVVWLVSVVHKSRIELRFGLLDAAVLALLAWECIAAMYASWHGSPRPALNMLWEWIGLGLVYFLTRQLVTAPRETRAITAVMIALMAAISAYGIYQYTIELPALQARFKTEGDTVLREAGLNYPPGTPLRDLLEKRLAARETIGTFAVSNSLAAVLAPWLVIGIGIAVFARARRREFVGWIVCLALLAVSLVLTHSRSGLIAAAIGIAWIMISRLSLRESGATFAERKATMRVAIALLIGCLLATAAVFAVHNQAWFVKATTSFGFRLQYWRATLAMIRQWPWLGCGPGNFQDVYTQFKLPEASEEIADPHNFLLEAWATAGTPALLGLLAVLVMFVWQVVRRSRDGLGGPSYSADQWKLIPFGALAGFLLALPLGQISSAPPSIASIAIGLPVAAACLVLLLPWIRDGHFPPGLVGVGLAVLLISLLTTQGFGIPSVAETLWLLLALGWNDRPHLAPRKVVIALLAAGVGLTFACYHTSYARVLPCQSFQKLAYLEYLDGRLPEARTALDRAIAADPRSSEACSLLAQVNFEIWFTSLGGADYEAFEHNDARARQLAPRSAAVWQASSARYQKAFLKTDSQGRRVEPGAINQALSSGRRAVELYPSSSLNHATLATICQQAGDDTWYRNEARAAIDLDDRMLHLDKKLPHDLRQQMEAAAADHQ